MLRFALLLDAAATDVPAPLWLLQQQQLLLPLLPLLAVVSLPLLPICHSLVNGSQAQQCCGGSCPAELTLQAMCFMQGCVRPAAYEVQVSFVVPTV
jgi:hypothetical protein